MTICRYLAVFNNGKAFVWQFKIENFYELPTHNEFDTTGC